MSELPSDWRERDLATIGPSDEEAALAATAYALWDTFNTSKLGDNPEEMDNALARAAIFLMWLSSSGHEVRRRKPIIVVDLTYGEPKP